MIKTQVVEMAIVNGQLAENELGWCYLPEVPVEKKPPELPEEGKPLPRPMAIKVNGEDYMIIGHSWDLTTGPKGTPQQAVMILVVQKVPKMAMIEESNPTLEMLRATMPAGTSKN